MKGAVISPFLKLLLAAFLAPGGDELGAAEKLIKQGVITRSVKEIRSGVASAVNVNSKKAVQLLLRFASLPPADPVAWPQYYWIFLQGSASITDAEACAELGDFAVKNRHKPIARDLMTALTGQSHEGIAKVMNEVLAKGEGDLQIMAADHLAAVGDKNSVKPLLKVMKEAKEGSTLRRKCGTALGGITGQSYGESLTNWEGWWEANKDKDWEPQNRSRKDGNTGTVLDRLTVSREGEFDRLKEKKILVIQAGSKYCCGHSHDYDHIDQLIKKLDLKVDIIDKGDLENPEKNNVPDFKDYIAILVNCTHIRPHCNKLECPDCGKGDKGAASGNRMVQCNCPKNIHPTKEYLMPKKGIDRLMAYLQNGGYLFAEDWEMEDFLEKMFPKLLGHGPERPEEKVAVVPQPCVSGHPYLRKIFYRPPGEGSRGTITEADLEKIEHEWKIDASTRTIKVKDERRVTTLLTSPDLKKAAEGHDAVAITFAVGGIDGATPTVGAGGQIKQDHGTMDGGRVLYVLSHFGKQGNEEDEFTLQNLLLNFLIEASERQAASGARKKR